MLSDTLSVLLKEVKEILHLRDSLRATVMSMVVPVVFIGIFFPVSQGARWVESYASLSIWFMIAFIMVVGIIADSFAGERERHTLESLLATRLGEPAILTGKVAAAVLYGFVLAAVGALVSLLTVSLTSGEGRLLLFSPETLILGVLTGFFSALTAAVIGAHVSLHATSARQAQQMLGFAMMFVFFSPVLLFLVLPEGLLESLRSFSRTHDPVTLAAPVFLFFFLLNAALFAAALMRFKRSKMILE